jgi:acetate kinase
MDILVINSGSSSIKYQVFRMPSEKPVCSGLVERIGLSESGIVHKTYVQGAEKVFRKNITVANHEEALYQVASLLSDPDNGVISDPSEIEVVGHRVVHGGESFAETTIITDAVKQQILKLFPLAPLHNPPNYTGIEVAEKIFPKATQVGVFDTAFHQSMPERAYRYAIPEECYTVHGIRAYGFHGTSHRYVSHQANAYLNNPEAKLITIHLGNGCSMTAVSAGKSVDTSMGFGPVSGLVMGTRAGDIDAAVIFYLMDQLGYSSKEANDLLNRKSGMLGLTGHSDMRDIAGMLAQGDPRAEVALELYAYRIRKYIGAYTAVLNGLDAIVFTAGVGENDKATRSRICRHLDYLGIRMDEEANTQVKPGAIREIQQAGAPVKILVIPTNEELEIANECYELLKK